MTESMEENKQRKNNIQYNYDLKIKDEIELKKKKKKRKREKDHFKQPHTHKKTHIDFRSSD